MSTIPPCSADILITIIHTHQHPPKAEIPVGGDLNLPSRSQLDQKKMQSLLIICTEGDTGHRISFSISAEKKCLLVVYTIPVIVETCNELLLIDFVVNLFKVLEVEGQLLQVGSVLQSQKVSLLIKNTDCPPRLVITSE